LTAASQLLLDTCAVIWLANGDPMAREARGAVLGAALAGGVLVSPVSAWEVGLLARPRAGAAVRFMPDPATWFARFMAGPGIVAAPFTWDIALAASNLPEPLHADPADRLLIATARSLNVPIVTRDERILSYGRAGRLAVIAC
jgi:PIN domain nuclease of toxin-antitoxin system